MKFTFYHYKLGESTTKFLISICYSQAQFFWVWALCNMTSYGRIPHFLRLHQNYLLGGQSNGKVLHLQLGYNCFCGALIMGSRAKFLIAVRYGLKVPLLPPSRIFPTIILLKIYKYNLYILQFFI